MNARIVERQALEGGLRGALERREFVLHYQPKVDLETGRDDRRRGADPLAAPGARAGAAASGSSRSPRTAG